MDKYAGKYHDSSINKSLTNGWQAKAMVELDDDRWMIVTTFKPQGGGGIATSFQACKCEAGLVRFAICGDFRESGPIVPVKCTEKSIMTQHGYAMDRIDEVRARALEFYAAKAEKDMARVCPVPPMPSLMTA